MSALSTPDLLNRAAAALLDPEQTAVAPEVAGPLSDLLGSLPGVAPTPVARQAAVMVLDHEHTRITAEPAPDVTAQAKAEALREAANEITGSDRLPLSRSATRAWLRALADDAEAGKR